ncbi:MAG TPA: O-linked N-acetylglucosamine transferase, SPINDLY family protein [Cyanobacteria bacterium UBA8803]|nr:O-linked N-acetylglucosamine transferase, SPINDLY family protein [Cyanobacteria bacterium UBA9273]HBL57627.1 O-linked N-acetylglucosamine transferase, SPINDLY family protein [Cyanobacteria bacterium UBA8803]
MLPTTVITTECSLTAVPNWQQQAYDYLIRGDYQKAASLYEEAIEAAPEIKFHYWNLGLVLMLQGQEAEAQMTWLLAMAEGEPAEVDLWTVELMQVLQTEAERRETLADYSVAWAIRQHMREISPNDINNLLHIIQLSVKLETFTGEDLTSLGLIQLLESKQSAKVDQNLLLELLQIVLAYCPFESSIFEFAEASLPYINEASSFIQVVLPEAVKIAYFLKAPAWAVHLAELCVRLDANNLEVLPHLASFYQNATQYDKGIETAELCRSLAQSLTHKIYASHLILRGLMSAGGRWQEAVAILEQHKSLLLKLLQEKPMPLPQGEVLGLFNSIFFLPYFRDEPKSNRLIQNQVTQLAQANIQLYAKEQVERYSQRLLSKPARMASPKSLKIGYLSHCFGMHSVGWLARWVFQYHDRDRFQVHAYMINNSDNKDPIEQWYINQALKAYKFGVNGKEIAEQIYQDEIDILIDLDSITLDISCEVMALKPAPVQATWLGWDASGLPTIDYFIADPYVLPDSAQDYYTEKIWRLPQTYIAIDGFEVTVPDIRRDRLDIPSDAVVYLSTQRSFKRHPDTARLQMRIIKEVPNSYFLVKGYGDKESIKSFFNQIAEEEGVSCDRLRFLPDVSLEATHRANLGIADVVLDTYPYNGATTTLETLWMCVPLVTRVGQQFAARNSYTMMINAGVTEGIAWTDQEYIEWGVRLGEDAVLRQQISWRLRQSRQTAPLWNAEQFTREMEKAYEQMWAKYVNNHHS